MVRPGACYARRLPSCRPPPIRRDPAGASSYRLSKHGSARRPAGRASPSSSLLNAVAQVNSGRDGFVILERLTFDQSDPLAQVAEARVAPVTRD